MLYYECIVKGNALAVRFKLINLKGSFRWHLKMCFDVTNHIDRTKALLSILSWESVMCRVNLGKPLIVSRTGPVFERLLNDTKSEGYV